MIELNVRPNTINCIRRIERKKFHDLGLGNAVLTVTPKAQPIKKLIKLHQN